MIQFRIVYKFALYYVSIYVPSFISCHRGPNLSLISQAFISAMLPLHMHSTFAPVPGLVELRARIAVVDLSTVSRLHRLCISAYTPR